MQYSKKTPFNNSWILILTVLRQSFSLNLSAEIDQIPEAITFKDTELDLLGDGIRREFLLDVYQIGFYSEVSDINSLVETASRFPLAIRIRVLTSLLPDEPPSHWIKLFNQVLNESQFKQFVNHYSKLEQGDILAINFRPEKGSTILIKGRQIININDAEFIKMLIDGFIGSDPVSIDLKDSILNS